MRRRSSAARTLTAVPRDDARPIKERQLQELIWAGQRAPVPPRDTRVKFGRSLNLDGIERALTTAQNGNMQQITDLSRETIDTDPHLSALLFKRFGSLAALPHEVIPADGEGIDRGRAEEYAQFVRTRLRRIPRFQQAIMQLAWGLFDGRSALETQWRQHGKVWEPMQLDWIHPRRLSFGPQRELRIVDVPTGAPFAPVGIDLREVPFKFVSFTPQLFGEYQEREGLAPRCLYWSFFKRFSQRERMILVELYGKPWRIITVEEESSADDVDLNDAEEVIELLGGTHTARMPRGTDLQVVQPQRSAGQVHAEVIAEADRQNSKLVLGQTGTTDGSPSGLNSNQTSVMRDEQLVILMRDAAVLGEAIEDGLTDPIIVLNFGEDAVDHAPRFVIRSEIPTDRNTELERLRRAVEAGLDVPLAEAYAVSGFRKPMPDEPVVRFEQPPTPPAAVQPPNPRPVVVYPSEPPAPGQQKAIAPPEGQEGLVADPIIDQTGGASGSDVAGAPVADLEPAVTPLGDQDIPPIKIGVADVASIVTVNEGRAAQGLGPLLTPEGAEDPDGFLTIGEYRAKKEAGSQQTGGGFGFSRQAAATFTLPMGPYEDFDACVRDQMAKGHDEESARRICGSIKEKVEGVASDPDVALFVQRTGDRQLAEALADVTRVSSKVVWPTYHDPRVCLARQPDTAFGSPEPIVEAGAREGARAFERWTARIAAAAGGSDDPKQIFRAVERAAAGIDLDDFVEAQQERLLHGLMLGFLDSKYETEGGEPIEPATFAIKRNPKFSSMRYADAVSWFLKLKPVTRSEWDDMNEAAQRRAFTIANAATSEIVATFQSELANMVRDGSDLRDFMKFATARAEAAGWTPANPSHVQTIYRTNVMNAYSSGRHAEMTSKETLERRPFWQIRTVNDGPPRQRATHRAVHNVVIRADDSAWEKAFPPFGFNCFLPGTEIQGRIIGASRALYAGKAVELTTAEGRRLSVTTNHPILTEHGFVRAGALRQGDKLVSYRGQAGVEVLGAGSQRDEHQKPALAEDVFRALADASLCCSATCAPDDFHGEAARFCSDVEVVGSYWKLLGYKQAAGSEEFAELPFELTDDPTAGHSFSEQFCSSSRFASTSSPGVRQLPFDRTGLFSDASPLYSLRLGSASQLDVALAKESVDDVATGACLARELIDRGPGGVELDELVDVREFDWVGHVYDFETEGGWLFAGNIAASNCRCRVVSLSAEDVKKRGLEVSTGSALDSLPDEGFTTGTRSLIG